MRSVILGIWLMFFGWGWQRYPTGKVVNMQSAGGLFFVLGSLIIIYALVFQFIPIEEARIGMSLYYLAWGWNWAFLSHSPTGNYLDLPIGSHTIPAELLLILLGSAIIAFGTNRWYRSPVRKYAHEAKKPLRTLLTLDYFQFGLGKIMGVCIEIMFLLYGLFYISLMFDNPSPELGTRNTIAMFFAFLTILSIMAVGYFASIAEDRKGINGFSIAGYVILLGLTYLVFPGGDMVRALLLLIAGALIIRDASDLSAKMYLPGKAQYVGIGGLVAGLFDLLYFPTKDVGTSSILTPSFYNGLFMGQRILEGVALIMVFVVLVILPRRNVHRQILYLTFLIPLLIYGVSLVLSIGMLNFGDDQFFQLFWIRGRQMSIITGVLIVIYGLIRFRIQYRWKKIILG